MANPGSTNNAYTESDIRVLEGLEAVRKRPGMYIGSTGARGLHHLVYEIVDNAIDEALAGHCSKIDVRIDSGTDPKTGEPGVDIVTVRDDGRGIPTGMHAIGVPTPEVIFTRLHAGGKFDNASYKVSGGLHGVGASVVNALSTFLEVEIRRDGVIHKQLYRDGAREIGELKPIGPTGQHGTTIRFQPDPTIFSTTVFDRTTLERRLQELTFLNAGLTINLVDARDKPQWRETWCYEGGLQQFVAFLNEGRSTLHDIVHFRDSADGIEIEVAFQYHDGYSESLHSFVNCIRTSEGGQHETGFKTAYTRVMNEYARRYGVWKKKENLTGDDVREGVSAALSLRMGETEFEGQTKTKLGNPEARAAVDTAVARQLAAFLEENPGVAKKVLEKASRARDARAAARKARTAARKGRESASRSSLGGKLTRCSSRKSEDTELIIVEGDSAGGSAKQGRDRRIQAILPLRGKPLNTERAQLTRILQNKEFVTIINAIGAGVGRDFDPKDARYGRIVILADADDDGAHIRCLLLTFLYRYMTPLVADGRVYIAQPPLFKVERGKGKRRAVEYAWTPEDMKKILKRMGRGATVQRYKGLGEMTPTQLWETTLNPETRTMVRVSMEDAAAADQQVRILMGDSADRRKKWISANVEFGVDPLEELRNAE